MMGLFDIHLEKKYQLFLTPPPKCGVIKYFNVRAKTIRALEVNVTWNSSYFLCNDIKN